MDLREAAQQALEALEVWRDCLTDPRAKPGWRFAVVGEKAITALRAALAEPTSQESRHVEPVGYFSINSYGNWEQNESGYGTPLYEAPPKREPLTDAELYALGAESHEDIAFVRRVLAAHGIGGEE